MEGLGVMKLLMERRKEELKEEAEAAEAKQNADREVRFETGIGVEDSSCSALSCSRCQRRTGDIPIHEK